MVKIDYLIRLELDQNNRGDNCKASRTANIMAVVWKKTVTGSEPRRKEVLTVIKILKSHLRRVALHSKIVVRKFLSNHQHLDC